jgi:hypothetical protein
MGVIQFPVKAKEVITRTLPRELIKQREGGGKKVLSYVSGSTVIDLLNEAFGYLWSWEVTAQFIQESQPRKKYNSTEMEPQGPVAHVRGTLSVPVMQPDGSMIMLIKSGFGSKTVLGGQADQEHVFKAAATDALKKAASLFGIGAQLYRDEDEQAFFDAINFEDPWTDELLAKFEPERDYIKEVMEVNKASAEDIGEIISEWSKGSLASIQDLTPDNIASFVTYLRSTQGEEEAEAS